MSKRQRHFVPGYYQPVLRDESHSPIEGASEFILALAYSELSFVLRVSSDYALLQFGDDRGKIR
jgi:hypothetical protein